MKREFNNTKVFSLREELAVVNEALHEATKELNRSIREFNERQSEKFKAAGGCEKCNGRSWRVVWDTLDSLSGCYAEYGPCENESCNASVTGPNMDMRIWSKYDSLRGTKDPARSSDYEFLCASILSAIRSLGDQRDRLSSEIEKCCWLFRGDEVVVVKGRKVPIGTTGKVFWTDVHPQHGMEPSRVGIDTGIPDPTKPGKNVVYFVAAANCEKLDVA